MNKCTLKEMILTAPAYTNTQPSKEEQNVSAYNYRGLKSGVDPDNYPGRGKVPHEFISGGGGSKLCWIHYCNLLCHIVIYVLFFIYVITCIHC